MAAVPHPRSVLRSIHSMAFMALRHVAPIAGCHGVTSEASFIGFSVAATEAQMEVHERMMPVVSCASKPGAKPLGRNDVLGVNGFPGVKNRMQIHAIMMHRCH